MRWWLVALALVGCPRRDPPIAATDGEVRESAIDGARVTPVASIPAPPVISATPSLGARVDRWVQVVGTLTAVAIDATITLGDGGVVRVERVDETTWKPLVGTTVTVNGKLAFEKGTGAFGLALVIRGPTAICAGVVGRCGM